MSFPQVPDYAGPISPLEGSIGWFALSVLLKR